MPVLEHRLILRPEFEIEGPDGGRGDPANPAADCRAAMIVPRNRLLFWFAIVVLPFALLGAVEPAAGVHLARGDRRAVALALADAAGQREPAWPASASNCRRWPACRRTAKPSWRCASATNAAGSKNLRLALALPREIESPPGRRLGRPAARTANGRAWPGLACRAERGNYRLETAYLETDSPLGFWACAPAVPAQLGATRLPRPAHRAAQPGGAVPPPRRRSGSTRSGRSAKGASSRSCANTSPATASTRSTGKPRPNAAGPSRRSSRSSARRRSMSSLMPRVSRRGRSDVRHATKRCWTPAASRSATPLPRRERQGQIRAPQRRTRSRSGVAPSDFADRSPYPPPPWSATSRRRWCSAWRRSSRATCSGCSPSPTR